MNKILVDKDNLMNVLKVFFSDDFILDLFDSMECNNAFITDANDLCDWISVDVAVPEDKDVYEVTCLPNDSSGDLFREFAYFNKSVNEWRSHFSDTLLDVIAWKAHTPLYDIPFN